VWNKTATDLGSVAFSSSGNQLSAQSLGQLLNALEFFDDVLGDFTLRDLTNVFRDGLSQFRQFLCLFVELHRIEFLSSWTHGGLQYQGMFSDLKLAGSVGGAFVLRICRRTEEQNAEQAQSKCANIHGAPPNYRSEKIVLRVRDVAVA
jgi:hypothetical protein